MVRRGQRHARRQEHPPEEEYHLSFGPRSAGTVGKERFAPGPGASRLKPIDVAPGGMVGAQWQYRRPARALEPPLGELGLPAGGHLVQGNAEDHRAGQDVNVLRPGRRELNLAQHKPDRQDHGVDRVCRVPGRPGFQMRRLQYRRQLGQEVKGEYRFEPGAGEPPGNRPGVAPHGLARGSTTMPRKCSWYVVAESK